MECEEINSQIGKALDWLDSNNDGASSIHLYSTRPNSQGALLSRTLQPISNRYQKFLTHLQPQAIDRRTRLVLSKLLKHAVFDDLNGCIFTGKQANVYYATKQDGQEFAVEVFRDHNIQGNYRFRHDKCKHNPRKIVTTWAENEMRNLTRLKAAGIRCATPILLRLHVVVMEFLGKSGSPAPCLKDANLSEDEMPECYIQMIILMRNLYQKCKLVHGDLSEYNILYYQGNLHIINVSQSVDLDHPLAFHLLRGDCIRISNFFRMNGVEVLFTRDLLDIIADTSIPDESVGYYLEEFNIPRFPKDLTASSLLYFPTDQNLLQRQPKVSDTSDFSTRHANNLGTDENDMNDDDSTDLNGVPCGTMKEGKQETQPADRKAARKENKKKVKEEKREARKTKTTKYVKKKKNNLSKKIKAR